MEPGEALGIAAQVAVTLAGFTSVVIVFGSSAIHEWPLIDKMRLQVLLMFSVLPLAFSLIALMLLTTRLAPGVIWRWSSVLLALALFAAGITTLRVFFRLPKGELEAAGGSRLRTWVVAVTGNSIGLLLAYNAIFLCVFWPFFAGIIAAMLAAILQVVLIILHRSFPPQRG